TYTSLGPATRRGPRRLERPHRRGGARLDAELPEDVLQMLGHRRRARAEDLRHVRVRLSLRHPYEDLRLAPRKPEGQERLWLETLRPLLEEEDVLAGVVDQAHAQPPRVARDAEGPSRRLDAALVA